MLIVFIIKIYYSMSMDLQGELAKVISGEVDISDSTRDFYSHDASIFELKPQAVVFPKIAKIFRRLLDLQPNIKRSPNSQPNCTIARY